MAWCGWHFFYCSAYRFIATCRFYISRHVFSAYAVLLRRCTHDISMTSFCRTGLFWQNKSAVWEVGRRKWFASIDLACRINWFPRASASTLATPRAARSWQLAVFASERATPLFTVLLRVSIQKEMMSITYTIRSIIVFFREHYAAQIFAIPRFDTATSRRRRL